MRIILASASPRRRELLAQMGMEFEVCPSQGEEKITEVLPERAVMELAQQKAAEIAVKTEGDAALFAYTKEFDKTEICADTIKVTEEEIKEAYEAVDPALIDVIRKALVNIRSYHEKQPSPLKGRSPQARMSCPYPFASSLCPIRRPFRPPRVPSPPSPAASSCMLTYIQYTMNP